MRHRSAGNNGKLLVLAVAVYTLLFSLCPCTQAQQPTKIRRIGFLSAVSASTISARMDAFNQGLREFGYVEGRNIIIERRYAEGKLDRLSELAAELVGLKVDIIVSAGPTVTRPTKQATGIIPIVMALDDDPIGSGFVVSLSRPGRNITGLSTLSPEISGKQLDLLREIIPKLARVAVIVNSTRAGNAQMLKETERVADALKVRVESFEVRDPKDIAGVFREASNGHADAALVLSSPAFLSQRPQTAEFAVRHRLPVMYPWPENVDDGGLMTYSVSVLDLFRRSAAYVDKLLKGAKPAELPVEQPTKFEFMINLKAAKQIALTIPPNVLARADRVIK